MPTSYQQRAKPTTDYLPRAGVYSDIWELADVSGNLIRDAYGNQITIKGPAYSQATQYLQREKP